MGYIDMHCDTLMMYAEPSEANSLFQNDKQVDFNKLKTGGAAAQFFAIFMMDEPYFQSMNAAPLSDQEYIERLYTGFTDEIKKHRDLVRFAKSYRDYRENREVGILSAFLTIEDGRPACGSLKNLQKLYDIGIRLITLTWNYENCFGFPNSKDETIMSKGLKPFGIEAIEWMNANGIIVDVSHLSDAGFWDVVRYSRRPFVASHSNCRSLSPHPRNLTDDMIRALGQTGSVSGINFCPSFLNENPENLVTTIDAIVAHIRHFIQIGGIECVGFGSDFDGIPGQWEIRDASEMPLIIERLERTGFLPSEIDKIAFENVERILRANLSN